MADRSLSADFKRVDIQVFSVRTPEGWTSYTHPRGWLYFRHDQRRIVTDEDVRIPEVHANLSRPCSELYPFGDIPAGCEVHILGSTPGRRMSILVDHGQCLATPADAQYDDPSLPSPFVSSLMRRRRRYWTFVQNHPVHIQLSPHAFAETRDALQALELDHILSDSTTAPFSKDECRDFLDTLSRYSKDGGTSLPTYTAFIALVLRRVYSHRLEIQYGGHAKTRYEGTTYFSRGAQPDDQLLTTRNPLLAFFTNAPFFGIPKIYLSHTMKASAFQGRLVGLEQAWQSYAEQLTSEYSNFVIVDTVLLSVTISFLAVPDIAVQAKLLCIISMFASLASVITGIFFIWRHHRQVSSSHTLAYIHNVRNGPLGLPGHALLLSLPPVFLVCAVLTFAAAVTVYSAQSLTGPLSLAIVFGALALMGFLVLCGVYTFSRMWKWK